MKHLPPPTRTPSRLRRLAGLAHSSGRRNTRTTLPCVLLAVVAITACSEDLPSAPELLFLNKVGQTAISVSPSSASIEVGKTVQLTVVDDAGQAVTNARWSTSSASVATVSSSGLVTGVSGGSATITALSGNRRATAEVTVTAANSASVASVSVTPSSSSITVGGTVQLAATVKDANGTTLSGHTITWASSNTGVATVSSAGLVSGKASGSATITATADGKSGSSAISVTSSTSSPPSETSPDFGAIKRGIRPRGFGASSYSLSQPAAGGTMYFVSTSGNDANNGSSTAPFRTINRAADVAVAGDVVTIRNGTYYESVFVRNSGTADKRIVFQAENRGGVVLTGGTYTFQPRDWYGILNASKQTHVTVRGLIFRKYAPNTSGSHALRTARSWVVDDCLFDDSGYTGVQINDHDVTIVRTTIQSQLVHAYVVSGGGGGTSPSDPSYQPVERFQLLDSKIHRNHTTADVQGGTSGTSVSKIGPTRGIVIDNVESYENYGAGIWLDEKSTNYTIRNSYIHSNRGYTINGTYNPGVGRGLYLEKLWAGGLVENNLIVGNTGAAIFLINTNGATVRNNLIAHNDQCINYVNVTTSGYEGFTLKDIRMLNNQCKDWARWSGIHAMGGTFTTPWEMNIYADGNTYEPVRAAALAWWPDPIHGASTIPQVQSQFKWEQNGRTGSILVP